MKFKIKHERPIEYTSTRATCVWIEKMTDFLLTDTSLQDNRILQDTYVEIDEIYNDDCLNILKD